MTEKATSITHIDSLLHTDHQRCKRHHRHKQERMWKQMTTSTPVSWTYYQLIFCCEIQILKSNNGVASRMRPISDLKHSYYVLRPLYEFSSERKLLFGSKK